MSFKVLEADEFVNGTSAGAKQIGALLDERGFSPDLTRALEFRTRLDQQRPRDEFGEPLDPDERWFDFIEDVDEQGFDPDSTPTVTRRRDGARRLVALGPIDGELHSYVWPDGAILKHTTAGLADIGVVPETSDSERFAPIASEDFVKRPPMRWLVSGLLPKAELAFMFGASGDGKTFLAYDIAAAVSRGIPWNGHKVQQGPVVIVAAEGAAGFRTRVAAYREATGAKHQDLPSIIADAPNLMDSKDVALLAKRLEALKPAVVVFDTLAACTPSANENSGEDMGRVIGHLKFIANKSGALMLCLAHVGKDTTKGLRGWSGIRAAADAQIEVMRTGDLRSWRVDKQKDGEDGATFGFKLKPVQLGVDEDGNTVSSCVVEHCEARPATLKGNQPRGEWEVAIMKAMPPAGTDCDTEELRAAVMKTFPAPPTGKRDQREASFGRSLRGLVNQKGLLEWVDDGERVKRRGALEAVGDDPFT